MGTTCNNPASQLLLLYSHEPKKIATKKNGGEGEIIKHNIERSFQKLLDGGNGVSSKLDIFKSNGLDIHNHKESFIVSQFQDLANVAWAG